MLFSLGLIAFGFAAFAAPSGYTQGMGGFLGFSAWAWAAFRFYMTYRRIKDDVKGKRIQ